MSLGLQSIYPFFFQRILGVSNGVLGSYFLCQSIMILAAASPWRWLSHRIGKKATFLIALGISVPVWASWQLADARRVHDPGLSARPDHRRQRQRRDPDGAVHAAGHHGL